ncbi:MAG: polynucleotide adenylyltransferase PcnB [Planctomycetota bacterium]|jgi:poly(A) polymerase
MQQDDSASATPSPQPKAAPIPRHKIDEDAFKVVQRLSRNGYDAYLVGGCVRDLLLGVEPKDFDIATSATPRQIRRLFRNSRVIGRRFRLVHVHFGPKRIVEVATFRAPPVADAEDDPYVKRDNVFGTAEQDAARRDFTINGLFYDVGRRRVIDYVDGVADLERRKIRMIGDPDLRLREDPVRILRAAKFAGRLNLTLTTTLHAAAKAHCGDLRKAAPARILEELYKLLSGAGVSASMRLLHELGALEVLLPELADVDEDFFAALTRLEERTGGTRDGARQWCLLAVLLWPHVRPVLRDHEDSDVEHLVQERIQPLLERFSVARRDSARARQLLAAQCRLAFEPQGRRATRLCRRDFFEEALDLRRIVGPLGDEEDGRAEQWANWVTRHDHAPPGGGRKKRKRRRRGGRKRRASSEEQAKGTDAS